MNSRDKLFVRLLAVVASISCIIVFLILSFLFYQASDSFINIGIFRFFTDGSWLPEPEASAGEFSLLSMLVSSFVVALFSLVIAAPIGLLTAIFIKFYSPSFLKPFLLKIVEVLAGLPSVVLGLWGLVVLVPILLEIKAPGLSILAGALLLAIMIVPTVIITTLSAYQEIPKSVFEYSESMGLPVSCYVFQLAMPLAKQGIGIGLLLALARAVGETMVVLMVCGNVLQYPKSIFDPIRTLSANIALEMSYAFADHQSALFFSALVLLLIVAILVLFSQSLGYIGLTKEKT